MLSVERNGVWECCTAARLFIEHFQVSFKLNLSSSAILSHNGLHLNSNHCALKAVHCLPTSHYVTYMQRDWAMLLLYFVWGILELLMITWIEAHIFGHRSVLEVEGVLYRLSTHMLFLLTLFQSYWWLSVVEFKNKSQVLEPQSQLFAAIHKGIKKGEVHSVVTIWSHILKPELQPTGNFSFSRALSWLI